MESYGVVGTSDGPKNDPARMRGNGGVGLSPQAPSAAAIPSAMQDCERIVQVLHDRIGLLEERLCAVLAPEAPSNEKDAGARARPPMSPLSQFIIQQGLSIAAAAARIERLLARLEV